MSGSGKRQRVGCAAAAQDTTAAAIAKAKNVRDHLDVLYGNMPEKFLGETNYVRTLIQPTAYHRGDTNRKYAYILRSDVEYVHRDLERLQAGSVLQIQGAKGSGKSTGVCTIVGYMIGKQKRRVVYICVPRFLDSPAEVMRHALLVATGCDESLARFVHLEEMVAWCYDQRQDPLLFVVDNWDELEDFPEEEEMLSTLGSGHILVKLSAKERLNCYRSYGVDAPPPAAVHVDGPYCPTGLSFWIRRSKLPKAKLEALDYLTGGMPGLLRLYEDARGDQRLYREKVEELYGKKLFESVIQPQTSKHQLASVVELVTDGDRMCWAVRGARPIELSCFYRDQRYFYKNRFHVVSPYLRFRAEFYIMEQDAKLQHRLDDAVFTRWAESVKWDCLKKSRNLERAAWNVEGLIIAVMRHQKKLWDGLPFMHFKTYEHGREAVAIEKLTRAELSEGVLLGPVALDEKALDLIYVKSNLAKARMRIKVVQVIFVKWKNKEREASGWQKMILPKWLSEGWSLRHQFVYVVPVGLTEQDLKDTKRRSWLSDNEDEDREGAEADSARRVRSLPTKFKSLREVHPCLSDLHGQLHELERDQLRRCSGYVQRRRRQCLRWSRTDQYEFACYSHQ